MPPKAKTKGKPNDKQKAPKEVTLEGESNEEPKGEKKGKKKKKVEDPMEKAREAEEKEIENLKKEIEDFKMGEQIKDDHLRELERQVRLMEASVIQLEAGNLEADDSPIKRKYDSQRHLNIQLAEQKKWLEHELEDVKLKQQNEKIRMIPDPFALDWDALSETEMKRLVQQLEATLVEIRCDLK